MTQFLGLACKLSSLNAGEQTALLSFLPSSMQEQVHNIHISKMPSKSLSLQDLLEKIDNSWYLPYLQKLSKKEASLFVSLFSEKKQKDLCQKISCKDFLYTLEPSLKTFLENYLLKKITKTSPIPIECLPEDPHNFLAALELEKIHAIVQYLGLYDLSFESKKILEKNLLEKIQNALSPEELNFVESIQYYPHPVIFPEMNLQYWNGNISLLKNILQDRGLNRLAKILSKSSPHLIFYVQHTLSQKTAQKFLSWLSPEQSGFIIQTLQKQFTHVWDYLCTYSD